MKTIEDARELAGAMIAIGERAGRQVKVLVTDMSTPLGHAVGNALEIREVMELLQGTGPDDLRELVIAGAGLALSLSDLGVDEEEGRTRAEEALASGAAWDMFQRWVRAQGGDLRAGLSIAPVEHTSLAAEPGTVIAIDALAVGVAAANLGAGRRTKADAVDHGVGIVLHAKVGDRIVAGEPLFSVYGRTDEQALAAARAVEAATLVKSGAGGGPRRKSVVLERHG